MRPASFALVLCLTCSCGDDSSLAGERDCAPVPCPSAAHWNDAACACVLSCDLDTLVRQRVSTADPTDCGVLPVAADAAVAGEAQACILQALEAGRAFQLIQPLQGTDSQVARAYVAPASTEATAMVSILDYDSDPSGGSGVGARVGEQTCRALRVDEACTATSSDLCLRCDDELELSLPCQESVLQATDCRGPGNYEVGKEGGYQPCCAGLREVFHKKPGDVNGEAVCQALPLRVYACVEGRCGDGRCEDAEAVPCGCEEDCPSARVGD